MHRRSRDTGYPALPAQIPACDFLAPGSSVVLTRAENRSITQVPDSLSDWPVDNVGETQTAPAPCSISTMSDSAFGSVDSAIYTTASPLPYRIPVTTDYFQQPGNSCNGHVPSASVWQAKAPVDGVDGSAASPCMP